MRREGTPLLPSFPHRFGRPRTPLLARLKRELADWAKAGRIAPAPCRFTAPEILPRNHKEGATP